jgi:hypothetical protein
MPMNPRLLRPLATGFNPKSIANLYTWWDFSDTSTLAQNSDGTTAATTHGDPVGYVKNKAGTFNLTQSDNNLRGSLAIPGLGGRTSVEVPNTSGAGWGFSPGDIQAFVNTIFIVAKYTGSQDWITFSNSAGLAFFDLAQAGQVANAWITMDTTPTYRVNGSPIAPTVTRDVMRNALGVNVAYLLTVGNIDWSAGITNNPAFRLARFGGTLQFIGDFGEILWYNRNLSASEVTAVERYLKSKWKTP